jgi:hypothetical protein
MARVVLLFLGEGSIYRDADEAHVGEFAALGGDVLLPLLALDDAALSGDRALLVLRGVAVVADVERHLDVERAPETPRPRSSQKSSQPSLARPDLTSIYHPCRWIEDVDG